MVENGRLCFLNALVSYAPEVIDDLLGRVDVSTLSLDDPLPCAADSPRWPRPVPAEVQKWADTYHLAEEWLLDFALDTLEGGTPAYRPLRVSFFHLLEHATPPEALDKFTFALGPMDFCRPEPTSGWNPSLETRAKARARIIGAFKTALETHLDCMQEAAEARGQIRPRHKTGKKSTDQRHFKWTVSYQCLGETFTSIAARERLPRQTVSEAVNEVAELIDLRLARKKGGRRRGLATEGEPPGNET